MFGEASILKVTTGMPGKSVLALAALATMTMGTASAKKEAQFLWFENCGAYQISEITVERREFDGGEWVDTGYDWNKGEYYLLFTGRAVCFYIGEMSSSRSQDGIPNGYQARLTVKIRGGDNVKCDSTWINRSDDIGTRTFKMAGTTLNNNGCRSKGYDNDKRDTELCSANGRTSKAKRC